jgi:hypothetical protein
MDEERALLRKNGKNFGGNELPRSEGWRSSPPLRIEIFPVSAISFGLQRFFVFSAALPVRYVNGELYGL